MIAEAQVVCRMLGFRRALEAYTGCRFIMFLLIFVVVVFSDLVAAVLSSVLRSVWPEWCAGVGRSAWGIAELRLPVVSVGPAWGWGSPVLARIGRNV